MAYRIPLPHTHPYRTWHITNGLSRVCLALALLLSGVPATHVHVAAAPLRCPFEVCAHSHATPAAVTSKCNTSIVFFTTSHIAYLAACTCGNGRYLPARQQSARVSLQHNRAVPLKSAPTAHAPSAVPTPDALQCDRARHNDRFVQSLLQC